MQFLPFIQSYKWSLSGEYVDTINILWKLQSWSLGWSDKILVLWFINLGYHTHNNFQAIETCQ